jgi:hypothetical protein
MKVFGIVVVLMIVVGAAMLWRLQSNKITKLDPNRAQSVEASRGLRQQILSMDPVTAGIQEYLGTNQVWGVIMETGYPEATVTLAALSDGNASLYFSSGGGVIGGIEHEAVRKSAIQMSRVADVFVASCVPTTAFPLPKSGETVFYILTKNGKVTATALENDLGEEKHPMSPLFYAGQDVITQLRLITENFK